MHSDFVELLQLLNEHEVEYLIIGGYAVGFYAEPRYTKDIDIWVNATIKNGRRIITALEKFGAPTDNLSEKDFTLPGLIYIFGVPPLRVDLLNELKGSKFKDAYKKLNLVKIGKLKIPVVDKETLIRLKRKAGRPQDKIDIKNMSK